MVNDGGGWLPCKEFAGVQFHDHDALEICYVCLVLE
jgi:hypothetical protein